MGAHRTVLSRLLGEPVVDLTAVSGGDVCKAFRVETAAGRVCFAKHHSREPRGMFTLEADGLRALRSAAAGALGVPEVLVATEHGAPSAWLVLEWVTPGQSSRQADAAYGRGLAALHQAAPPPVAPVNWLGPFAQRNHPVPTSSSWPDFWWTHRLAPRVETAARSGQLPVALRRRFDVLQARIPELLGTLDPMSLLHGDLWSGNRITDDSGRPWLVDPAVCVGHREVDLAMMALFGGFGAACWEAYGDRWPLAPGHDIRQAVYQLYYQLVHVELFGAAYLQGLEQNLEVVGA